MRVGDVTAAARLKRKQTADTRALLVREQIKQANGEGAKRLSQVADWLNSKGIKTSLDCNWTKVSVSRVIKRVANISVHT